MIPAPVRSRRLFTSWAETVMLIRTPRQDRTCGARAAPRRRWRPRGGFRSAWRARPARSRPPPPRGGRAPRPRGAPAPPPRAAAFSSASLALGLLALAPGGLLLGAELGGAVARHVGDALDDDLAGADRVVVARDHEVHGIRVAVGVDEPDDRDLQALGLAHADGLGLEVHHEHRVGRALHVGHAAEVRLELVALVDRRDALADRQQVHRAGLGPVAQVVQAPDALVDGLEVGRAARPASAGRCRACRSCWRLP